ncbi:hypothetical protein BC834DRAFT_417804 [Gloeopeniophorella convolvens]|nr:hypothetical protein BC834DRAFT_417804 [Gloeopeniophorella convolvens]
MSLPHSDCDSHRVCLNPFPFLNNISLGKHRPAPHRRRLPHWRPPCGPFSMLRFSLRTPHAHPPYGEPDYPVHVHVSFADWTPPLCALLGMRI